MAGLENTKRLVIFKISWIIFLLGVICDYNLAANLNLYWLEINVPTASIGAIMFVIIFFVISGPGSLLKSMKNRDERKILLLLTILLGAAYISSIFSINKGLAMGTTIFRYTLFFFCFICAVVYSYNFKHAVNFIIRSMIYFNLMTAGSIILDFHIPSFNQLLVNYFGHMENQHIQLDTGDLNLIRPSGFITEVNLAALGILMSNILMLLNADRFRNKWFPYFFYAISGYAFGMTVSRSALLGIIICLVFLCVYRKSEIKKILLFALIFFSAQALTPQTQYRIAGMFQKKNIEGEVSIGRPVIWKAALKAFESNPLTGVGISVFFTESLKYVDEVLEEQYRENSSMRNKAALEYWKVWRYKVNPHSIIFTMLTELGLIGIAVFLLLIITYVVSLYGQKRYNSVLLISVLLLISCFASYAPYYKYFLLLCMILYMGTKQDMVLSDENQSDKRSGNGNR